MKLTLYTMALCNSEDGKPLEIKKHVFDSDENEDYATIEEYLEDENDLDEDDWHQACEKFLYECVCLEYEQQFIRCIILEEEQYNYLKEGIK